MLPKLWVTPPNRQIRQREREREEEGGANGEEETEKSEHLKK